VQLSGGFSSGHRWGILGGHQGEGGGHRNQQGNHDSGPYELEATSAMIGMSTDFLAGTPPDTGADQTADCPQFGQI